MIKFNYEPRRPGLVIDMSVRVFACVKTVQCFQGGRVADRTE